jgi:Na+-translocating ferredoxin:NAD+ oxidoreductase RnfG subunit
MCSRRRARPTKSRLAPWLAGLALLAYATAATAKVFYARDEALQLAFPQAERTEARNFFLTAAQRQEIERRAKSKLESDLLTVYVGFRDDTVLGYALLDTHLVRTLPETFMVVLSPEGVVSATHVLAFHEPLEYLPSDRWLQQFTGKRSEDELNVGRGVAAITGSTLTSRAVASGIRRALAIHAVLLKGA